MFPAFSVVTAASDRGLLSPAELRTAVGAKENVRDSDILELGTRVAAVIARACLLRADGATPPTLRQERISDTFELDVARQRLTLSRRPVTSIVSVTECGVALTEDDYRLDRTTGLLQRRCDFRPAWWLPCVPIVVTCDAGWAIVPAELKLAAARTAIMFWSEGGSSPRDPNLKRVRTEGVDDVEYWVPPASDPLLSGEILDLLEPFTENWV